MQHNHARNQLTIKQLARLQITVPTIKRKKSSDILRWARVNGHCLLFFTLFYLQVHSAMKPVENAQYSVVAGELLVVQVMKGGGGHQRNVVPDRILNDKHA